MGLDMYLEKEHYVGGHFEHAGVTGSVELKDIRGMVLKLEGKQVESIREHVGYWRKANQIHKWFVDNVQEGRDECQDVYVPTAKLIELRELCEKALKEKDPKLLPPQSGFFFGGTDIDEWYWQDLKQTIEILEDVSEDDGVSYYYRSSW